ncbi:MAG: 3-oxoacid CoA-transferase subunit B [Sulfurospirillaceae bacterium]|nr:3-oxoacid CoA-transferase subunit B [Sulfurospirillaceae bacterium]
MYLNAKERMLKRAAMDIKKNQIVNLGMGYPTKITKYLEKDFPVCLHSENGISGVGGQVDFEDADRNLIDAGGTYIRPILGAAYFDSSVSFSIVRSGRLDLTILGAFQVAANGDLANWMISGSFTPGAGGAIELAQKACKVHIISTHLDKKGRPKIMEKCTLPLTAKKCVNRIYTDMAVLDIIDEELHLIEIAEEVSISDVINATDAKIICQDHDIKTF